MTRSTIRNACLASLTAVVLLAPITFTRAQNGSPIIPNMAGFADSSGVLRTFSPNGGMDLNGPFFQNLGTNDRSCATCHTPSDAMSVSAAHIQTRFDATQGLDPIFRPNDGSNCDHNVDLSTVTGRSAAYTLLRTRGLFRIAIPVPQDRDFEVVSVRNPYGCNESDTLSMYRRPLPATNLRFLSAVMSDGRESSTQTGTIPLIFSNDAQALESDLEHQALDATLGHAQGLAPGPTAAQLKAIADFEMGLFTAQAQDRRAGDLTALGASGGPVALSWQGFYIGINDPVGLDPNNPLPFHFNAKVFSTFDSWSSGNSYQQAVARGQEIFNTKTFTIAGVAGLNGATFPNGITAPDTIVSTCGVCHNSPNVGDHSVAAALNIGVADPPGGNNVLDTSYLPVITICQKPGLTTCVETTDPGRALISGKFTDIGKVKGPILRGLAARAPYFHNGSAPTLSDVIDFYDARFHIGFTAQEKSDLVAFLSSL